MLNERNFSRQHLSAMLSIRYAHDYRFRQALNQLLWDLVMTSRRAQEGYPSAMQSIASQQFLVAGVSLSFILEELTSG